MEYIIICIISLLGSGLTLFSGFGLGTLLTPVFAIFFPIELAIGMTAVVHFLNNVFKFFLLGKHADKNLVLKFGIPSLIAAFLGAWVLTKISGMPSLFDYSLNEKVFSITPVKLTIALLLIFFALAEAFPSLTKLKFKNEHFILGGLLSGFFGGLSGNQGALRTAFLVKANLAKEQFIATGIIIACMVDVSRLIVYNKLDSLYNTDVNYKLIAASVLCAFAGAYFGNLFLKKVTINFIQKLVAAMLLVFAVLLGAGIL
ncbi:MAG TPA: sulfite exporter TauE/SafE family protein [Bacteroidia bacterium]|jgi:uncharacterized membrane protein YfcA|nr:sulfite exporter TauE/SafE family protein [Bacteroidia bacterium]